LIPASPWLSRQKPGRPQVTTSRHRRRLRHHQDQSRRSIKRTSGRCRARYGSKWKFAILPATLLDANLGVDQELAASRTSRSAPSIASAIRVFPSSHWFPEKSRVPAATRPSR
jgi:hypothetical protein